MARGKIDRPWRLVRVRRRQSPNSMRQFSQRVRRRAVRELRPFLVAGLAIAVVVALGWVVFGSSVLGVREIDVTGSVLVGADRVRAVADVDEGTPLARVDTDAVRYRVRTLISVADARVRRSWPTTLVIEVSERVAVAAVARQGTFLVLDAKGVVFTTAAMRPRGLALLRVVRPGPDDASTLAALRVLAALTPELRQTLRQIVADSPTRIRLELTGGREIVWGGAEESDAKARVATSLLSQDGKTIDVSAPGVVTVR